jgi:hypothetical protein
MLSNEGGSCEVQLDAHSPPWFRPYLFLYVLVLFSVFFTNQSSVLTHLISLVSLSGTVLCSYCLTRCMHCIAQALLVQSSGPDHFQDPSFSVSQITPH